MNPSAREAGWFGAREIIAPNLEEMSHPRRGIGDSGKHKNSYWIRCPTISHDLLWENFFSVRVLVVLITRICQEVKGATGWVTTECSAPLATIKVIGSPNSSNDHGLLGVQYIKAWSVLFIVVIKDREKSFRLEYPCGVLPSPMTWPNCILSPSFGSDRGHLVLSRGLQSRPLRGFQENLEGTPSHQGSWRGPHSSCWAPAGCLSSQQSLPGQGTKNIVVKLSPGKEQHPRKSGISKQLCFTWMVLAEITSNKKPGGEFLWASFFIWGISRGYKCKSGQPGSSSD